MQNGVFQALKSRFKVWSQKRFGRVAQGCHPTFILPRHATPLDRACKPQACQFSASLHSPFAASCPYRQRASRIALPGPDREWLSCFSYGDGLHSEHSEPPAAALARSEANARTTAFASMGLSMLTLHRVRIFDSRESAGKRRLIVPGDTAGSGCRALRKQKP